MQHIQTIDRVLEELDQIIDRSVEKNDFSGLFTYVYRRTTAEIRQGILDGRFNNNEQMELFDVIFARLYIEAYNTYHQGNKPSASWLVCFESKKTRASIAQHILMGMNAHINLDLAIAAASVADGNNRDELKEDFDMVNQILKNLIDEMQSRISRASKLLYILDWLGGRRDERYIDNSIRKFRGNAWRTACSLMDTNSENSRKKLIQDIDNRTAEWNRMILSPPNFLLKTGLKIVSLFEEKDIAKIIENLRSDTKPLIKV